MIILNPTVGVAPGTTTIQLGDVASGFTCLGGDCPQNPAQTYTSPLEVVTELPSKAANPVPPGMYWDPYVEEHRFQGLDGAGPQIRWGFVLFAGVATFAGAVAIKKLRKKPKGQMAGLGDQRERVSKSMHPVFDTPSGTVTKDDRKIAKDKGDCLILGNYHPNDKWGKFGRYSACLTKTQKKKLRIGKKLGCGVFACAYEQEGTKNRVVKFTRDAADVASLIEAQKSGAAPKLYGAYTLAKSPAGKSIKGQGKTPVYALVLEKLRTFSDQERDARPLDTHISVAVMRTVAQGRPAEQVCKQGWFGRPFEKEACDAAKTAETLQKVTGIEWSDAHAGNVGYTLTKTPKLKILDMGLTKTALAREPELLEGLHRKVAGRLKVA